MHYSRAGPLSSLDHPRFGMFFNHYSFFLSFLPLKASHRSRCELNSFWCRHTIFHIFLWQLHAVRISMVRLCCVSLWFIAGRFNHIMQGWFTGSSNRSTSEGYGWMCHMNHLRTNNGNTINHTNKTACLAINSVCFPLLIAYGSKPRWCWYTIWCLHEMSKRRPMQYAINWFLH